jgi:uncharacterized protein with ParB-like and HNH nuclease domain
MATKISLKCINELLHYHFVIPSYQRGYRWTEQEVNDLLNDILEFTQKDKKSKDEFYCLQPIVVASSNSGYSVIDGQQRLTTIYIIMLVLSDIKKLITEDIFSIYYETRKDSEEFLKNIDLSRKEDNIDYYHICNAYEAIKLWFEERPGSIKLDLLRSLLSDNNSGNNVKVIWYEIDSAIDPINIFTRINMGKIPLTNAELIKALFLREDNFNIDQNADVCRLRQLEIANEWDNIEYTLWNNEFWYFLTNGDENYENRIELIFDIIANIPSKTTIDKYYTFRYFNQKFKSNNSSIVEDDWSKIKIYYLTFYEWFENRECYHLIGYLISLGERIIELKNHSSNNTKTDFKKYLVDKIKLYIKCNIDELDYEDNSNMIKRVLLLFNIITLLDHSDDLARFQFNRYKAEKWDIEHIHSVQSEMPLAKNHQNDWLKEVFNFTSDPELKNKINNYLDEKSDDNFEALYNDILKKYSESGIIRDIHDISNLTLLDSGTNRGYKNAIFPIKRQKIIEKDKANKFIPVCTKNIFLKYYTANVEQMTFWGKTDRQAYLANIKDILSSFLDN